MTACVIGVVVGLACCGALIVLLLFILGACVVAGQADRDLEDDE